MKSYFNNKEFWCGSINLNNGTIEEVHTMKEAEKSDFHYVFYFSEHQVENIKNKICSFFWIDDGKIYGEWPKNLSSVRKLVVLTKIREQVKLI